MCDWDGVFLDGVCFFAKNAKGKGREGDCFGGCVFLDGVCFFAKNAKGKGREGLGEGCVWWMFMLV